MTEFRHILFPVDFSPRCGGTVPFVKQMAGRYNARITLLETTEISPQLFGATDVLLPESPEPDNHTQLRLFTEQHFTALGPSIRVDQVWQSGDPAYSITSFAESNHVDLIMMPTHGYGRFRALLLGSVTAKVLHDAKCPVWTGVHLDEPPLLEHLALRNVLCAVDLKKDNVPVAQFALAVAAKHGATLRLVHTVPSAETRPEEYFDEKMQKALIEAARTELVELQRTCGGGKEAISVEAGSVSSKVRSAALQFKSDLIVIGRGLLHAPFGRLRSNAYAIIRDAPCPVLSV